MTDDWLAQLHLIIGDDDAGITTLQMLARGLIVFVIGVALVRVTTPRLFGKATPIDIVLAVIIGSNLSRTITGNAPFLKVVAVTVLLVAVHAAVTRIAMRWRPFANLVKGKPEVLARDGKLCRDQMKSNAVGERDVMAAVRKAGSEKLERVKLATLERNGEIDVILMDEPPNASAS